MHITKTYCVRYFNKIEIINNNTIINIIILDKGNSKLSYNFICSVILLIVY